FLTTGGYPGDGKPKPVSFPDPREESIILDGFPCLTLPRLIELKIASGISSPGRVKDLGDAQEVIRTLALPRNFAEQLNPFVGEKYEELWSGAQNPPEEL